jgi:hypothetical protein
MLIVRTSSFNGASIVEYKWDCHDRHGALIRLQRRSST